MYKDTDSQIWVSVFGGGLNKLVRYDKEKREPIFKSYGIREGMNNDVVKSIVEDKNGNLWFTTEIGLSCFNKATEQFRNYDKYDGFLNVELEETSLYPFSMNRDKILSALSKEGAISCGIRWGT